MDTRIAGIEQLGDELTHLANVEHVRREQLARLFEHLYPGIVRQVSNIPIDIRIEPWMYDRYPELRQSQRQCFWPNLGRTSRFSDAQIARTTPPTVYGASNVMNAAFAVAIAQLCLSRRYSFPSGPIVSSGGGQHGGLNRPSIPMNRTESLSNMKPIGAALLLQSPRAGQERSNPLGQDCLLGIS